MPLLEVQRVDVRFGGLHVLHNVTFECEPGEITGLIGPNGAGKTTTFNVISGVQTPTEGTVILDGVDVSSMKPHIRARRGMARTFQRLEVFGSMTARDNVRVAAEVAARRRKDAAGKGSVRDLVNLIIERVGLTEVADEQSDALPTGHLRLVELGRALATGPSLLLLDEPSSGLNERESAAFGELLTELAQEGLGILLVEHDVPMVMEICARVHVLDQGIVIASGTPAEIQANVHVQEAYLGSKGAAT
ncbi:MAG: ABC transporter ATP-binding protein [Acidimicrobiia bacterium]|jgi:branched-chain amino acid transport system ATP-binding protein|nr:ABC transporter ATP-binding protein [Acidimicrobiia bacterium]